MGKNNLTEIKIFHGLGFSVNIALKKKKKRNGRF